MSAIHEEFEQLQQEKGTVEAEITAIVEELTNGPNAPGLKGPLVDSEGFPRADIDVYRVRHQRHRFACLQTDHQVIMKKIEELLPKLFEARQAAVAATTSVTPPTPPTQPPMAVDDRTTTKQPTKAIEGAIRMKKPFAMVENVQADSPAAIADMRTGDQVIVFGTADASNHRNLEAIKEIVLHNVDCAIRVIVRRRPAASTKSQDQWEYEELVLAPQPWKGAGVLGCLIMPLQAEEHDEAVRP